VSGLRPAYINHSPITTVRCPVHGRLVGVDGEGQLLGRCDGCMREAARALALLRRMRGGRR